MKNSISMYLRLAGASVSIGAFMICTVESLAGGNAFSVTKQANQQPKHQFKRVPKEYRCLSKEEAQELGDVLWWSGWPESFTNELDLTDPVVKKAVDSSLEWVRRVLRPELVPDDLELHPLKRSHTEIADRLVFRYEVDGYVVQGNMDWNNLGLLIHPQTGDIPKEFDEKAAREYVALIMNKFLRDDIPGLTESDKGKWIVAKKGKWYWGHAKRGAGSWRTNGRTVLLVLTIRSDRPRLELRPDWLTTPE